MTGDFEEIRALRSMLKNSQDAQDTLLKVARAVLMFHHGGEWTISDREEWTKLTGATECTTAALCTFAREQMAACLTERAA